MKIYIICPVRKMTFLQYEKVLAYVNKLEKKGHTVFFPPRDINQTTTSSYDTAKIEVEVIKKADEIHVYWINSSSGSHFDFGVAFSHNKKMILINDQKDHKGKNYLKVLREYIERYKP